jgi:pimeloyl-ACP methyl ester carboxylesterase
MLHYTDTGKGKTMLVFLHYFGGSGHTWQAIIDRLKDQYRCIAIDMLGFGKSPAPEKPSVVADNSSAVLELLKTLSLDHFTLIGHSMGGKVAIAVAAQRPAGLQNIVLLAPSPPCPEPMTYQARVKLDKAWQNQARLSAHIKSLLVNVIPQAWLQQTIADNMAAANFAWQGWLYIGSKEDISGQMRNIDVPITVISASEDKGMSTDFLREEFGKYFASTIIIEVENSGHLLPLEKPDEVAKIIQQHALV